MFKISLSVTLILFFAPLLMGQEVTYHIVKSYDKDGVLTQNDTLLVNHHALKKVDKGLYGGAFVLEKKIYVDSIKDLLKHRSSAMKIAEFVSDPLVWSDSLHFEASKVMIAEPNIVVGSLKSEPAKDQNCKPKNYDARIDQLEERIEVLTMQLEKINRRLKKK